MNNFENEEILERKEINLLDYWNVIWKRKWAIFAVTLIVFAVVTIMTYMTTPLYRAKGTLLIEKEPNILSFEEIFQIETLRDDYFQTQYKLLQSRALAYRTVEKLKIHENGKLAEKLIMDKENFMDKSNPLIRKKLADSILGGISITPISKTRLVEVSFISSDPKFAAEAVNVLFDSFIDMNIEIKYAATEQATEFLTDQITKLRHEIEKKERKIQAYGAEKNIVALSDKETTIVDKLGELNQALTGAQIDRIRQEVFFNEVKIASPDYIPETLSHPLMQKLREEYIRLKREYNKKQKIFKPDYPEMQRLQAELDSAKRSLQDETKNVIKASYSDFQTALKKEKSLEEAFNKLKQESFQLNSNAILYNSLKIEIENKNSLLESLLRRQNETGVAARLKGLRTSNVRIIDRAEVPLAPSSPKKKQNIMLGLLIGLIGGIALAFFFDSLDNSIKSTEDVERHTRLPTLGIVPKFSTNGHKRGYGYAVYGYGKNGKNPMLNMNNTQSFPSGRAIFNGRKNEPQIKSIDLITHLLPNSTYSESYRSIRTAILLSSTDPHLKVFAVSSSLPSEGKTATVINLAVTFAQANKKVLIVDADLRKPQHHRVFGIRNFNGLTNYLATDIEPQDVIKRTQIPNLYLINSGPVPPDPAELLSSEKMMDFIKTLKQTFDYVIFDTPPILVVSDALMLGAKADGIILIVWGGKTPKSVLRQAKEKLDLLKIKSLGVVINNINLRDSDYNYKHYYYPYYGDHQRVR